jgi:phytoene dehydrogenase-like protein
MADKSIIIIGAGMAGLSAGCYAQMNGYKTQIFELHNIPGGLCTSWKRKGYTFDGCIHYLMGSRSGPVHQFFEELGAIQDRSMIDSEEFLRIERPDGNALIVYADIDRLEQHMKDLSAADAGIIEEFCSKVRLFSRAKLTMDKPAELMGFSDMPRMIKLLPVMRAMRKYNQISQQDFAKHFQNPFLREVFPYMFEDVTDLPMSPLMMTMAELHKRNAGWPLGGSAQFARAIEKRYGDLGGKVHYKSRVEKILVDTDHAIGVRLADGSEHHADIIISAADGRSTIFDMLDGKYIDDKIRRYYEEWPIFEPLVQVSLGIARDLSKEPHSILFFFDEPLKVGDQTRNWLHMHHYCFDPSMAPPGKSVITVCFLFVNYEYWKKLYRDPAQYKAEKAAVAGAVIDRLELRFPGIKDQIDVADVATPVTYERYTGNWRGSYEGWGMTTATMGKMMKRTLPGLGSFYMAGQWVFPGGGIPGAVMSGRHLIQIICKRHKRRFTAMIP